MPPYRPHTDCDHQRTQLARSAEKGVRPPHRQKRAHSIRTTSSFELKNSLVDQLPRAASQRIRELENRCKARLLLS